MIGFRITAAATLLLLSGCSGPKTAWSAASPEIWTPRPAAPQGAATLDIVSGTIGLEQTLTLAAERGLDVRMAVERWNQRNAEHDVARAAMFPSLRVGTGVSRLEGRAQNTPGIFSDVTRQNASLGGRIDLELDFGEAQYAERAAADRLTASAAEVRERSNLILRDAAWAYFDLVEARETLRIAESAKENASGLLDHVEALLSSGAGLEVDVLRVRSRLASIERERSDAVGLSQMASANLSEILALAPEAILLPESDSLQVLELVPLATTEELLTRARTSHPGIARERALVEASRDLEEGARRSWMLPNLVVSAGYAGFGFNYGDLQEREAYSAALEWDLGLGLFGERDRARSELREAELREERTRRAVEAGVLRAALAVETSRAAITAAEAEREAARGAFGLARARNETGAGLLLETLEAELDSRRAERALVQSISSYNRAQYSLFAALGGERLP